MSELPEHGPRFQAEEILDAKYENSWEANRIAILKSLIPTAPPHGRALDLGCGSGVISRYLVQRGWSVTAVDLDAGNVERASEHVQTAIHGEALTVCGDLAPEFGLVCAFELIEHLTIKDREDLIAQCRRVCDGELLVSTPNRWSPEGLYGYYYLEKVRGIRWRAWDETHQTIYSSREFLQALRRSGWTPEEVTGYHYRGHRGASLPLTVSRRWPLNRLGFNTIVKAK